MPKTLVVDDNVPLNFKYNGGWEFLSGSTRQWEGGIHSTFQNGATVSFRFRGSGFRVQGTIPGGSGNVLYEVITDGVSSGILTQVGGSANVYDAQFYAVSAPGLRDFVHTVVIANRGSQSDLDLRFDRVILESLDADPTMASPPSDPAPITTSRSSTTTTTPSPPRTTTSPTITSLATSTTSFTTPSGTTTPGPLNLIGSSTTSSSSSPPESTSLVTTTDEDGKIVTTQLIVTAGPGSVTPTGSVEPTISATSATGNRGVPLGALIGGVLGALVVVILVFLFFRQRRRRRYLRHHSQLKDDPTEKRGGVLPTPYDLGPHPGPSFNQTQDRGQNPFTHKAALRARMNEPEFETLGQSSSGQAASSHHHQKGASTSTHPTTIQTCSCSNSAYTSAAQTSSAAALSHRHSTSIHAGFDQTGQESPQADYRHQYLSGATVVAGSSSGMTSMYGETVRTSLYDSPPAYQATSTSEGNRMPLTTGHTPSHSTSKPPIAPESNSS